MSDHKVSSRDHELHEEARHAHLEAAHHFELAAKHHRLAAAADHKDDTITAAHQAYIAYGHVLHGIQFAEEAAQEDLAADHDDEDYGNDKHTDHSHDHHGHVDKH